MTHTSKPHWIAAIGLAAALLSPLAYAAGVAADEVVVVDHGRHHERARERRAEEREAERERMRERERREAAHERHVRHERHEVIVRP